MPTGEIVRFQLVLHYDGAAFHGWQVQPAVRTVQGELEAALLRLTRSPRSVVGSGRTDSGVHATGQVAAVDLPTRWNPAELRKALNAVLPGDVWVERVARARSDFHPRYDARGRTYRYAVGLSEGAWSPFRRRWCWPLRDRLAEQLLHDAAERLPGRRSFERFAKSGQEERGHHCTVERAEWRADGEGNLDFRMTADRYLHHMVRYLVGTMVDVARGRRPAAEFAALLSDDPGGLETSPPAPPEGLFLEHVRYPADRARPEAPPPARWSAGGAADVDPPEAHEAPGRVSATSDFQTTSGETG